MRPVAFLAALCLAAAVGGCGSDDKSDDGGGKPRQEPAGFQERAGGICSDAVDQMTTLQGRTREALRRAGDAPAATDRIEAREYRRFTKLLTGLHERLKPLEAQAPDKAAFRAYLAGLQKVAKQTSATGEDIAGRRLKAAIAGYGRINVEVDKAQAAADRLELAPCAELPSPAL